MNLMFGVSSPFGFRVQEAVSRSRERLRPVPLRKMDADRSSGDASCGPDPGGSECMSTDSAGLPESSELPLDAIIIYRRMDTSYKTNVYIEEQTSGGSV